jgi:hypothetical protein
VRKLIVAATVSAVGGLMTLGMTPAQAGTGGERPPAGVVSPIPASSTPRLASRSQPREQIRQLAKCGGVMYAVGSFSSIKQGSRTFARTNVFSFSASPPYKVTSWAPRVVGSTKTDEDGAAAINSIAFSGRKCKDAYIGGNFTRVNGTGVRNIAEISVRTGNVLTGFAHSANGTVNTLAKVGGHLLTGGKFTSINGASTARMISLNSRNGRGDGFLRLSISGSQVYNQQLSHGGTRDLVEGVFSRVGGVNRHQMFMLNVGGSRASVTAWTSPDFNVACTESFWARSAAWSPDDSTVYVATTGFHTVGGSNQGARSGPCDAALAYPATRASVGHKWVNYTGCDSLYSVAADTRAAYFGGHERFSMNGNGCNGLGAGGYNAPGLEGLDSANGALYINSAGSAGYYSRARGLGADDMLATSAGLWIASDNLDGSDTCGGQSGHAGICFLPYG